MQKMFALMGLFGVCGGMAFAQDHPTLETFLGYTYMRANSATNVPAFSANGGSAQVVYDFNKWFGAVMDIGATHNGNISGHHLDGTFVNYLWGPRLSVRFHRITPYFNILFGGMRASESIEVPVISPPTPTNPIYLPGVTDPVPPNSPVSLRAVHSQTAFAMTVGGGLDIRMSKHLSFRPIGLDYMLTRLQNIQDLEDRNQHNLRYTAGFNFTFGAQ